MSEITVIDNFIALEYQLHIKKLIDNSELPVYYSPTTTTGYVGLYPYDKQFENPQFTHKFIDNYQINSDWWETIKPMENLFFKKIKHDKFGKLKKCKLNLNYQMNVSSNDCFIIHKDMEDVNGITAIYYVNDCDGSTLFFNETGEKVIKEIKPKQGSMVYFDNQILHAGQPTLKNNYRAVINFNWLY